MLNEKKNKLDPKVLDSLKYKKGGVEEKNSSSEDEPSEEKEEYKKSEDTNTSLLDTVNEVFSLLAHSEIQVHLWHLQTKGQGSYAMHKALNVYYEEILGLRDTFVESAISRAGRPDKIEGFEYTNYDNDWCCTHFEMLCTKFYDITEKMSEYKDLENICADILQLLHKTKYLLTLK